MEVLDMSCYHPMRAILKGYDDKGKKILKIVPYEAITTEAFDEKTKWFELPCGHCLGCRSDQAREWSNRLLLESLYHDSCLFVTLTYNDEHCPITFGSNLSTGEFSTFTTLDKRDVQLFLKRLRYYCPDDNIRYYLAGEYGDRTDRAHYHAIIFGLHLPSNDLTPCGCSETGNQYFRSNLLEKVWSDNDGNSIGFVSCEPANYFTFKYVAAYVTKKLGSKPNLEYELQNRVPPFSLSSRRPAIGLRYFEDHPDIIKKDKIVVGLPTGPVSIGIPKYYKKKLRELYPEEYEKKVEKNLKTYDEKRDAELSKTDLAYIDYLAIKEQNHYAKRKSRSKV